MATIPAQYNNDVNLRDAQHASRLFRDDNFRLAPKHKFLFHVAFSINEAALKTIDLKEKHKNEINMLVKTVDLPKFTISTEMANQYNRKKVIQYQHKPDNINIKFHDDNMGLINQLWQNYYGYYYADSNSAKTAGAYNRTATRSSDFITTPYGLDNRSTIPFFNYITIYQMARHEYVSYTLKNPLITSWGHGTGSYADVQSPNEKSMTIAYEAVSYGSGAVEPGTPEGFALEHYDLTPSPRLGNTISSGSASPSFATSSLITTNAAEFLNNLTRQINTYQNTKELNNGGQTGLLTASPIVAGVNGIAGTSFPVSVAGNNNTVIAVQINLGR